MSGNTFEESVLLKELHHYLPSQTPLKDFIHHNTLHAFQHKRFYEGIFDASAIFGYHVTLELDEYRNLVKTGRIKKDVLYRVIELKKGSDNKEAWLRKMQFHDYDLQKESRINKLRSIWNNYYHIDLNNKVQPLLFRILAAYLDQGISNWNFPVTTKGFLDALRIVEKNSYVSFFSESLTLSDLLKILVGQENLYNQYIFDQQFAHRGWAGMVATIESRPDTLFEKRSITLRDLIHFELLLEIDILDDNLEGKWQPISQLEKIDPIDLFAKIEYSELQDVLELFQDAFEWSYYDAVLGAFVYDNAGEKTRHQIPKFQAVFCIDERECSLRRHLEFVEPHCETFGAPGFFGVEFYFQPEHAKFYEKLCPAPVTPKFLIKEEGKLEKRKHELLYHKEAHSLFGGFLFSLLAGWLSLVQLVLHLFQPKMSPAISNAFSHVGEESLLTIENLDPEDREKGLQIGFNIEEMTQRIKAQLSNMGMVKDFAPLVYIVAHGSSSANNPHHGAHDCGACSGRPGSVNARVFSFMANHKEVRVRLAKTGIEIPDSTRFVGALHDTAADEIRFFDISELDAENKERHQENILHFETALDFNAKERSRRFASINSKSDIKAIRKEIKKRSVSLFEPRPELGHGSNALCIIGRRSLTKDLFLDRRAFLNSYDYTTDPEGELLVNVIRPIGPVCGGINLEYYFSRIDNHKLGAGTKLPHNVMGLIGVANSSDGDLRPGLPVQMIEVHDPVRLLIIVEHYPAIVLKTIQSAPEIYEWYINEWVHLVVINPEDKLLYHFSNGQFLHYDPLHGEADHMHQPHQVIANGIEMSSFEIEDATRENLPVFRLNK
ncbi:MAG TPA: DUF2309 domain-containing protein [Sediminibacterium sp.]|nr:DUF2309 domain-containing protein [Sediminibacterium sp.]